MAKKLSFVLSAISMLVLCGCDGGFFAERVKEALSEQFSEWELVRLADILR